MTELRALVYRSRLPGDKIWFAQVDDTTGTVTADDLAGTWMTAALSWPEAMQLAYKMLRDIDRLLMDQVHASRASRRERRCSECREVVREGKAHWKIGEGPCMILPAEQIDPDTAEDTYPTEATA